MLTFTRRAAALFLVICCGCATSLRGGAQTAVQTGGPISQEATFAAAAGIGDAGGALLLVGRGTIGVDTRTARAIGSITTGYEWSAYGHDFSTVKTGYHFAVHGGPRMASEERVWALVLAEAGYSWVVERRPPTETSSGYGVTSLTLSPTFGAAFRVTEDGPPSGLVLGVSFGVRSDSFSDWGFHF